MPQYNWTSRLLTMNLTALIGLTACPDDDPVPNEHSAIDAAGTTAKTSDDLRTVQLPAGMVTGEVKGPHFSPHALGQAAPHSPEKDRPQHVNSLIPHQPWAIPSFFRIE